MFQLLAYHTSWRLQFQNFIVKAEMDKYIVSNHTITRYPSLPVFLTPCGVRGVRAKLMAVCVGVRLWPPAVRGTVCAWARGRPV